MMHPTLLQDLKPPPQHMNQTYHHQNLHTQNFSYIPYFLRSYKPPRHPTKLAPTKAAQNTPLPQWLRNAEHFRLIPGIFPNDMHYHFDGLATVLKFSIDQDGNVTFFGKPFRSDAYTNYDSCLFFGTGTGPTLGSKLCFQNPGVNLLPFKNQLWLTIDTSRWGRVDPHTLESFTGAKVEVPSLVLNAHPACDRNTDECFVQHPCPDGGNHPLSDKVCFSKLIIPEGENQINLGTKIISRAILPSNKIIQHSHSPCVTPNFLVSKLDAFEVRSPFNSNAGVLKYVHQGEDSLWMIMDRNTKESRLSRSKADASLGGGSFVNNHFWNCFEDASTGDIVVETVATTKDYLDNYFDINLNKGASWHQLFYPALRCRISPTKNMSLIPCEPMLKGSDSKTIFDYPTFNPLFKMSDQYRFFYAIAAANTKTSKWFDEAIKVDTKQGRVVARWSAPNVYLTEFDFVPRGNSSAVQDEDDGVLMTVLYNATSDKSSYAIFDAKKMAPLATYDLGRAVPFHAHGISCRKGEACFTNP